MDQESPKANQFPQISYEDAVRFFKEVVPEGKCPMCGNTSWRVPLMDTASPVSLVNTGLTFESVPRLAVALCCNICGFYRHHDVSIITNWLENNQVTQDAAE